MLKFRPSNRTSIHFNEHQLIALIEKGLSDNSLRGFLYKRSSPNAKWRLKWFLLFENLLFYFDLGQNCQQQQLQRQHEEEESASQQHQHQHQQQHQQQLTTATSKSVSGPSKTLSSLIRRSQASQPKEQQRGRSPLPVADDDHQANELPSAAKTLGQRRASAGAGLFVGQQQHDEGQAEPTVGRLRVEMANGPEATTAPPNWRHQSSGLKRFGGDAEQMALGDARQQEAAPPARPGAAPAHTNGRQRLSSEPQNCSLRQQMGTHASKPGINMSTNLKSSPTTLRATISCASRVRNSSSISGVSGHFSAHNEQTIGRSTTTTAGKTATANYSSLLNRKIGVIFLEGSYCERMLDSAAAPDPLQPSASASHLLHCAPANPINSRSSAGELDVGDIGTIGVSDRSGSGALAKRADDEHEVSRRGIGQAPGQLSSSTTRARARTPILAREAHLGAPRVFIAQSRGPEAASQPPFGSGASS